MRTDDLKELKSQEEDHGRSDSNQLSTHKPLFSYATKTWRSKVTKSVGLKSVWKKLGTWKAGGPWWPEMDLQRGMESASGRLTVTPAFLFYNGWTESHWSLSHPPHYAMEVPGEPRTHLQAPEWFKLSSRSSPASAGRTTTIVFQQEAYF